MFKPIILEKTEQTPEVILDKENNVFLIKGKSIILDALNFYTPIFKWFEKYFKNPNKKTELVLDIEYINSPSTLQIIRIINLFDISDNKDNSLKINWLYDIEDERAMENGEEFKELTDVEFKITSYESDFSDNFDFDF